jgi:hypothetical protein
MSTFLYPQAQPIMTPGLAHHQFREHTILLFTSFPCENKLRDCTFLSYYFPDLWIHDLRLLFAINYTSHVSFFHLSAIFQRSHSWVWPASIAIWNKNKVIVSFATIIWVANISFIIYGKRLSTCPGGELKPSQTWIVTRYHSGKIYLKIFLIPRAYPFSAPLCMDFGARRLQHTRLREQ